MDYSSFNASCCPVTRTVDLIGGKWKPAILYLIEHGINRFGLLKKSMPRLSKKVLTQHLRELEQDQLITRHVEVSTYPQVVVYHLTERGTSLRKLIDELFRWGATYLPGADTETLLALQKHPALPFSENSTPDSR